MRYSLLLVPALATAPPPAVSLIPSIQLEGGLTSFIRSHTGPEVDLALDLSQIDLRTFNTLKDQVIPRVRANAPGISNADLIRECVRFLTSALDTNCSQSKATIWCIIAARGENNLKLNVSLSDEAFTKVAVPLARQLDKKRPAESQLVPAAEVRAAPSPVVVPQPDWRGYIWEFTAYFVRGDRATVPSSEIFSDLFYYHRINPRNLVLGTPPGENSIPGKICDFIESMPAQTRLKVLDILLESSTRQSLHDRVNSIKNPDEKLYANYIVSALYIPEEVVRLLIKYTEKSQEPEIKSLSSASQIVDHFNRIDPSYSGITPERILEWYSLLTTTSNLSLEKLTTPKLPRDPPSLPRLNFRLDAWRHRIVHPRKLRLNSTGIETLWELPSK